MRGGEETKANIDEAMVRVLGRGRCGIKSLLMAGRSSLSILQPCEGITKKRFCGLHEFLARSKKNRSTPDGVRRGYFGFWTAQRWLTIRNERST